MNKIGVPINTVMNEDCMTTMAKMPDKCINMVMTSPPYWALRDYGTGKNQFGLEPTFDEYVNNLCDIFDEVKRVLRDDGVIFVNIGDTYGGSGGSAGHTPETKNLGRTTFEYGAYPSQAISPKEYSKCLLMIPFRFAIEMVNRGWILRNTIIWYKRNCMPSSVKDRFTVDFEYLFFFSKEKKYYFEQQFDKSVDPESFSGRRQRYRLSMEEVDKKHMSMKGFKEMTGKIYPNRNKRTVWTINPKPFSEAHFAVFPEKLVETPIKAGCPEFVCKKCGKPREKIYQKDTKSKDVKWHNEKYGDNDERGKRLGRLQPAKSVYRESKFVGLTDCGCGAEFTGGIVYEPFFGAGTTGLVALRLNRNFIGSEISAEYCKIAEKRLVPVLNQVRIF